MEINVVELAQHVTLHNIVKTMPQSKQNEIQWNITVCKFVLDRQWILQQLE